MLDPSVTFTAEWVLQDPRVRRLSCVFGFVDVLVSKSVNASISIQLQMKNSHTISFFNILVLSLFEWVLNIPGIGGIAIQNTILDASEIDYTSCSLCS